MWISLDQTDSKNWFESNLISLNFPQNFRSVVIKITWGWNVLNAQINVILNADGPDDPGDVGWHVLQYLIWSIWSFRQMIRMTWDQYDHWGRLSGCLEINVILQADDPNDMGQWALPGADQRQPDLRGGEVPQPQDTVLPGAGEQKVSSTKCQFLVTWGVR